MIPPAYAIIQARTGSTRLPGKVLADLGGRPMLSHVIERARAIRGLEGVVVATTHLSEDDLVAKLVEEEGALLYRGEPEDVLDRYRWAARLYGADIIMRITGDCPLLDPEVATAVLGDFRERALRTYRDVAAAPAHFMTNLHPRTYPDGLDVEVFSQALLEVAWLMVRAGAPSREHPTLAFDWLLDVPTSRIHLDTIQHATDRWTVDTAEDLQWVRQVVAHLAPGHYTMDDTLEAITRGGLEPRCAPVPSRR